MIKNGTSKTENCVNDNHISSNSQYNYNDDYSNNLSISGNNFYQKQGDYCNCEFSSNNNPKFCSTHGEVLNRNWNYCPYCGKKLQEVARKRYTDSTS